MNYVYYFKKDDNTLKIQQIVDEIYKKLKDGQFSNDRVLLAFYPGYYNINLKVGFFTEVIGLGLKKEDTIIKNIMVEATFLKNYNALCNFNRSISNLTCDSTMIFAVSQGTSLRKVLVNGDLYLHHNGGPGSGGFIANCHIKGKIYSGPQQQYFLRDSYFDDFVDDNWNMFFINCKNVPSKTWPIRQITSFDKAEYSIDKPYLVYKDNIIQICVNNNKYYPISSFYKVKIDDNSRIIQEKLDEGYNLLFETGIYYFDEVINVADNKIILGIGYPTILPKNKDGCFNINGNNNQLAGLFFDAIYSNYFIKVIGNNNYLFDIFCRIGGAKDEKTYCETSIIIDGNNCFGENFWLWRADHSFGVGIDKNVANHGLIVNGDNNIFYALMVEHFLKYQTIFNGESCKTYFYQSETPYEFTNQNQYKNNNVDGYASYKVNENVKNHFASGVGIYSVFLKAPIWLESAIEAPNTKNVYFYHATILELGPNKGIRNTINNIEGIRKNKIMRYIIEYKSH